MKNKTVTFILLVIIILLSACNSAIDEIMLITSQPITTIESTATPKSTAETTTEPTIVPITEEEKAEMYWNRVSKMSEDEK